MQGWKTWLGVGLMAFGHAIPLLKPEWQGTATSIFNIAGQAFAIIGIGHKLDKAANSTSPASKEAAQP